MAKSGNNTGKASKSEKASKREVLAYLEQHGSGDSRSVTIHFGYLDTDGEFTRFNTWSDGQQKLLYANLQLTSYWSPNEGFSMGSPVRYEDILSVELRQAEQMAKTLRQINTGLKRLDKEWGYAQDFGTVALRTLKVLKIKQLWRKSKTGLVGKYQVCAVIDLSYVIGNWVEDWKQENNPVEVKAEAEVAA